MKKITFRAVTLAASVALLTGCSNGPSDSTIEESIQNSMPDFMQVSDVERVNGYEEGDNKYVVDITFTTTYTKSLDELMAESSGLEKMQYSMLAMAMGKFKKGDSSNEQQTLTFVDTENGWQMRD